MNISNLLISELENIHNKGSIILGQLYILGIIILIVNNKVFLDFIKFKELFYCCIVNKFSNSLIDFEIYFLLAFGNGYVFYNL